MSKIIDYVFLLLSSFSIAFIWSRYYFDSIAFCLIVSTCFSLMLNCLIKLFFPKLKQRVSTKKLSISKQEQLRQQLILMDSPLEYFQNIYNNNGYQTQIENNYLIATLNNSKVLVGLHFYFKPLDADKINWFIKTGKLNQAQRVILFYTSLDKNAYLITTAFKDNLALFDLNATAVFLNNNNAMPSEKTTVISPTKKLLNNVFKKERSRYYLISGIFLALTALISFMPLYYCIISSILLFMSMYSRFNVKFNNNTI